MTRSDDPRTRDLQQAVRLAAAGDLQGAETVYAQLLASSPDDPRALAGYANLAMGGDRLELALGLLQRLHTLQPDNQSLVRTLSMIHNNIGSRLRRNRQNGPAREHFEQALGLHAQNANARFNLAIVLVDQHEYPAALACLNGLAEASASKPDAEILACRAQCLAMLGQAPAADREFGHALELAASDYMLLDVIAVRMQRSGRRAAALAVYERLARDDPQTERWRIACARLLIDLGRSDEAQPRLTAATAWNSETRRALARVQLVAGEEAQAKRHYATLSRENPDDPEARLAQHLALPPVYRDATHLQRCRTGFADGLHTLSQDRQKLLSGADMLDRLTWSNFYLAYQGYDDRLLQERYGRLVTQAIQAVSPALLEPPPQRKKNGPLRIGLISSFFRDCTVGAYFSSWVRGLRSADSQVHLYQIGPKRDALTEALFHGADHSRFLLGGPHTLSRVIRADALDVAIFPELGMDGRVFTLAACRLAPLQCAAWGHPSTTGLASIDCFLSSAEMEPEGAAAHYSERLVQLSGIGTAYQAPPAPADVSRQTLGLPENTRLYLAPQSPFKLHPDNDALMLDVLTADPGGMLILLHGPDGAMAPQVVARLQHQARERCVELNDRIKILPELSRDRYLALNACCDVMLDTIHWSGGNASLDALHAGLPIVTVPGALMRARQSAAMLRAIGLSELVTNDRKHYVETALRVATDRYYNRELRTQITARTHELHGQKKPIEELRDFVFSCC